MTTPYTLKHFKIALAAFFVALGLGTVAFKLVGHESLFASFYRATVTISLTGIDSRPPHIGAQIVTVLVILAGMAIYGYLASAIVELIAHGVLTGVLTERRKKRVSGSPTSWGKGNSDSLRWGFTAISWNRTQSWPSMRLTDAAS